MAVKSKEKSSSKQGSPPFNCVAKLNVIYMQWMNCVPCMLAPNLWHYCIIGNTYILLKIKLEWMDYINIWIDYTVISLNFRLQYRKEVK